MVSIEISKEVLTATEIDVLEKLVLGYTNKKIASMLHYQIDNIREHLENIYTKLGIRKHPEVSQRVYAAVWYLEQKWGH